MISDTLTDATFPEGFLDTLPNAVNRIMENTDAFHGFTAGLTLLTALASLATIIGFWSVNREFRKMKITKNCQAKIIIDMVRHFFINNAISEAIRMQLDEGEHAALKEGILEKYCVLESDIELANLNYTDKSYDKLHNLRYLLRNYNIVARLAEKHLTDPECPLAEKLADLDELWDRSARLTNSFIQFAKEAGLNVSEDIIRDYIVEYFTCDERANIADPELLTRLPQRPADSSRRLYDSTPALTKIFNEQIATRVSYAKFQPVAPQESRLERKKYAV